MLAKLPQKHLTELRGSVAQARTVQRLRARGNQMVGGLFIQIGSMDVLLL